VRVASVGEEAIIEVSDTGPGIDAGSRDRIFDRFYRDGEVAGSTSGAGLGLSIAKGAVEANGGHLVLVSTGSGGSTFRISLPSTARPLRQTA
jgi:two-component system OmpR family sensor kinase